MKDKTRKKIIEKIKLNNVSDPCDSIIESIAMDFPHEYSNEDEYIDFQVNISNLIKELKMEYKHINNQDQIIINDKGDHTFIGEEANTIMFEIHHKMRNYEFSEKKFNYFLLKKLNKSNNWIKVIN